MGIEIPAHIEDRVRQLVEDGRYETDADVLRAAIGALESRDAEAKKRRLKALVLEGFASGDAGVTVELISR